MYIDISSEAEKYKRTGGLNNYFFLNYLASHQDLFMQIAFGAEQVYQLACHQDLFMQIAFSAEQVYQCIHEEATKFHICG
jgi:hypothetical protein